MTQGSTPPYPSSAWPAALRRGVILGMAAACHLALLALLLRPVPHRESRRRIPGGVVDAMHLVLIPAPTLPHPAMTSARPRPRRLTALAPRSPRIEVTAARTTIRATPTIVTGLPPRLATDHAALDYRANDFRNRLQDAQRARVVPLPGAAAPRIGGLRLRVAPSARDIVRQLTVASRCTAERFKMRASTTQFITAQLLDRALEADGCGPHAGRTSASEAVDAVSRELMDER